MTGATRPVTTGYAIHLTRIAMALQGHIDCNDCSDDTISIPLTEGNPQ
ncbi:MAG: hypothetical protein GY835_07765 [bacterium]|nr:hypothetical protein [bacterium]